MKAWTYVRESPFKFGGTGRWEAVGFVFDEKERSPRHDLGRGYFGYVLQSPQGATIVVEERSGQ